MYTLDIDSARFALLDMSPDTFALHRCREDKRRKNDRAPVGTPKGLPRWYRTAQKHISHSTMIPSKLFPKRECSPKRVKPLWDSNLRFRVQTTLILQYFFSSRPENGTECSSYGITLSSNSRDSGLSEIGSRG